MSVYLYGIRKCRKTPVVLPDGSTVVVEHKLALATTNATGGWDSDNKRVSSIIERATQKWGYKFTGPVFSGTPENGVTLIQWDGAPYWYDTDKYSGTVMGTVLKTPKGWSLFQQVELVTLRALPTDPPGLRVLIASDWVPATRVTVPVGMPFLGREVLFRQTL